MRENLLVLISIILVSELGAAFTIEECKKYITDTENTTKDICIRVKNNTVYLKKCSDDKICDFNISLNSSEYYCNEYHTNISYYPGEYCRNNIECYSNMCINNICKPIAIFEGKCINDIYCNAGFYCDTSNNCKEAIGNNGKCNDTIKCKANLVCNNGVCVKIGSKKLNEEANNKYACESFRISDNKCAKATSCKQKNEPHQDNCEYDEGISSNPECGINKNGHKYCNLGEADVELNEVFYECVIVYKLRFKRGNRRKMSRK